MRRAQLAALGSSAIQPGPSTVLLIGVLLAAGCGEDPTAPGDAEEVDIVSLFEPGTVTMLEVAQLLQNGGLEEGDARPLAWQSGSASPADFDFDWSDEDALSGTRSLSIRDAGGSTAAVGFWAQTIRVANPVGMTFELSISVKVSDLEGAGVSVAIRGDDSSLGNGFAEAFATTQGREVIDGTQEWTTYTVQLHHLPADIDRITIYLVYLPNTTGLALFDEATLSVLETVPVVELLNTDMEEGGTRPDAWWAGGPGYASSTLEWSTSSASSGARSLGIDRAEAHTEEFSFWAQTIDAADFVGGSATLSVRVLTEGLAGVGAAIAIRADDTPRPEGYGEAFATTQGEVSISGTSGWATYEVSLSAIPAEVQSVTVYLIHLPSTRGSVYFDDVSLVPG